MFAGDKRFCPAGNRTVEFCDVGGCRTQESVHTAGGNQIGFAAGNFPVDDAGSEYTGTSNQITSRLNDKLVCDSGIAGSKLAYCRT